MLNAWWIDSGDLDDDQKKVVRLHKNGSYLVQGPPGSGKTNLLLLRAAHLVKSGVGSVRVLMFTRTLKEFISSGCEHYELSDQTIRTANSFFTRLLKEEGQSVPEDEDFNRYRRKLAQGVLSIGSEIDNTYDVLLLDEAQDFVPEEVRVFLRMSREIFAVADSNQKIHDGADALELIGGKVDKVVPLKFHFRNGLQICTFIDKLMEGKENYVPMHPTANYPEGDKPSSVTRCAARTEEEMIAEIENMLRKEVVAYPEDLLGVIAPRKRDVKAVWRKLQNSDLRDKCVLQLREDDGSGYFPLSQDKPIILATIHSAKGLEFRALHIARCDKVSVFARSQKRVMFTAASRAQTSLSIHYTGVLPAYIERAMSKMDPKGAAPKLEDLFRKGGP